MVVFSTADYRAKSFGDLDDRRDLARSKQRNAGKPGTEWETVKKEIGLQF